MKNYSQLTPKEKRQEKIAFLIIFVVVTLFFSALLSSCARYGYAYKSTKKELKSVQENRNFEKK